MTDDLADIQARIEAFRRLARRYAAEGDPLAAGTRLAEAASEAAAAGLPALAHSLDGERLLITGDPQAALGALLAAHRIHVSESRACVPSNPRDPRPGDDRTRHLIAEAMRRLGEAAPDFGHTAVHVCARVGTYREFARKLPLKTDTVVELGAAEGHCTLHLARRCAHVFAVEQAVQSLERGRIRCAARDNITWLALNAFDTGAVLSHVSQADLLFVDLGGSTWPTIAFRAAAVYHHLYSPRAVVVRNVDLNDFVASISSCESDAPRGHWRGR